jgi:hypothetical protein
MKKIMKLITVTAVLFISCTREIKLAQNNNSNNSTTISGDFTITKYINTASGEDSTAEFTGYVFSFTLDGKVTAEKNSKTMLGTYTESPSHEGQNAKLGLYFSNRPLSELNKNYYINFISDEAIHLSDNASWGQVLQFTAR